MKDNSTATNNAVAIPLTSFGEITVSKHALQVAFDVAVNSMDFGSGFLCDEEVKALREVAVALGVDPMLATPRNFKCKYGGSHRSMEKINGKPFCYGCNRYV